MLPFKKILCPTDFSEASYEALGTAHELARHFGAELLVVHVVLPAPAVAGIPQVPGSLDAGVYEKEIEDRSRKTLEELVRQKVPKDTKVKTRLGVGAVADEIVRQAEQEGSDLIVIATHGQAGWRRFLFGSVTEKVIRLASQAVLVVQAPRSEA